MDKNKLRDIMELIRTGLVDDDTECVQYIGYEKYLNLVEAYVKLRELIEEK